MNKIQRLVLGTLLVCVGFWLGTAQAQPTSNTVLVANVQGSIDRSLAPYLERVLSEAEQQNASSVIIEIDTPGGNLDATLQMRERILEADVPTLAFVNREALSAGALLALSADEMYMAPGAIIGAAQPITGSGAAAGDKTLAAVQSVFRASAELRGRDPQVAEAMVDPAIAIDGLVED